VESQQAAQGVVAVGLGVGAGAGEVGAAGPVHPRGRVRRDIAFTPGGRDQAVQRGVGEAAVGGGGAGQGAGQGGNGGGQGVRVVGDPAFGSAVPDREDVAGEVVVVPVVLDRLPSGSVGQAAAGVALTAHSAQPERVRIVAVAGHDAVGVGDERALALGVVGDPLDVEGVVEPHLFQPASAVVPRAQLAAAAPAVGRGG